MGVSPEKYQDEVRAGVAGVSAGPHPDPLLPPALHSYRGPCCLATPSRCLASPIRWLACCSCCLASALCWLASCSCLETSSLHQSITPSVSIYSNQKPIMISRVTTDSIISLSFHRSLKIK